MVALLYVTVQEEELNPFGLWSDWDNALPAHEYRRAAGDGSSGGGKIDSKKQQMLVDRWLGFAKDYIEVKEAK
jgi:hypothetical protein